MCKYEQMVCSLRGYAHATDIDVVRAHVVARHCSGAAWIKVRVDACC